MYKVAKRYGTLALAILVLVNALSATLVFLDYELRKDFIAEVLCINREKPQFHCAGSCHLKKNLKKSQEAQTENPDKVQFSSFEFVAPKTNFTFLNSALVFIPQTIKNFGYSFHFYPQVCFSFFHPPQA